MASNSTSQTSAVPVTGSLLSDSSLWQVVDPEVGRENPVEDKHRRLIRSQRSGALDRELKPNPKERDELAVCHQVAVFECSHPLTFRRRSS